MIILGLGEMMERIGENFVLFFMIKLDMIYKNPPPFGYQKHRGKYQLAGMPH